MKVNPLNANPEKWSNKLKQIVGKLPTICLSVFDHFMNLALKGLRHLYRRHKLSVYIEEGCGLAYQILWRGSLHLLRLYCLYLT